MPSEMTTAEMVEWVKARGMASFTVGHIDDMDRWLAIAARLEALDKVAKG